MKTCSKCKIEKPESGFSKDANIKSGLSPRCKQCAKAYDKKYNAEHKEERKAQHAEYKEEIKKYNAEYHVDHPEMVNAIHQKRRARKAGGGGSYTAEEWLDLVEYYGRCLCCGRDDVGLTADHVVPIALGGSSNIDNIQPLCLSCNSSKGIRVIDYRPDAEEWT